MGGYDFKRKKQASRSVWRFNIVTEQWHMLAPMHFAKAEACAVGINEFKIAVAGGRDQNGKLQDTIEVYDIRENTWKVSDMCLMAPQAGGAIVSSQKDRMILVGGELATGPTNQVQEIDLIKNRRHSLPSVSKSLAKPKALLVNENVYVFGNDGQLEIGPIGERYVSCENKWKDIRCAQNKLSSLPQLLSGPAALLFE